MSAAMAVPALLRHIPLIAPKMRQADALEVWASDGLRPAQAIRASMRGSDFSRTLFIHGECAAIFGVKLQDGVGVPWVLTTTVVDRFPIAFWKASKHVLGELAQKYGVLAQCIDWRHAQALRWVKRLGMAVDESPHRCGPEGALFHHVFLRREEAPHAHQL